jgi:cell wall-active antibiotic response 4TMS protein YvqF/B-box zinc finger protein
MKCAVHPDVEATGYCRNCGKAMCPQCTRDVRGALYCESCLAGLVSSQQPLAQTQPPFQSQPPPRSDTSPRLAAVLGFIPGLGAVYNGEYMKALIHVLIFGSLIAVHNSERYAGDMHGLPMAFIHLAIVCFYFYMPIDAYRVAKARRTGSPEPVGPLPETVTRSSKPIGAMVLIFLGVTFLLANFGLLNEDWLAKAWPLGLIALGGWMVWQRLGRTNS